MKRPRPWSIFAAALAISVAFWVADAVYGYLFFPDTFRFMLFQEPLTFWDSLILNVPGYAMLSRLAFVAAALSGGLLLAILVRRWTDSESARLDVENRYRIYIDNAPEGVLVTDREDRCCQANPAALRILGQTLDQLRRQSLSDLVAPEDVGSLPGALDAVRGAGHFNGELRALRADGRKILVSFSAVPLDDSQILIFFQDITESRQVEDELRQARKMDSIGRLAGGLAHDFNNQLTAIMGNAQLLKMELDDESDSTDLVDQISQSCNRAADLTRQLLDFSRRETTRSAPVDIHRIIEEACKLAGPGMPPNVRLTLDASAGRAVVTGDPSQAQNAVLNLLFNARDAVGERPNGQIHVRTDNVVVGDDYCRNHPDRIDPGEYIRLSVTDTGDGMTAEVQEHIFEPFFTTKGKGKGTGLGLSSVYGMVKAHRGFLQVRSSVGHGTTVSMVLPAAEPVSRGETPSGSPAVAGQGTILFADDEEVIRRIAVRALEALGYSVESCVDGQAAVDAVKVSPSRYDLVILDIIMPRLGGVRAMERIHQIAPNTPVMLISGYSQGHSPEDLVARGASAFLSKPFTMEEFSRVVAESLGSRQPS